MQEYTHEYASSRVLNMSHYRRFRERSRQWGPGRAFYWQIMHLVGRTLGLRVHYVMVSSGSGRQDRVEAPVVPPGYRVRMTPLTELTTYAGRVPALSEGFLAQAKARKDTCVASFFGEDLVGFSFQSGVRAPVTEQLDILVPEGFRYTYKTWVHEQHRKRGLTAIQNYVRHHARGEADRRRGFWYVETHNYPSLLHKTRYPSDRALIMGLIGWFSCLGREIPFRTPRARWLGVEFVQKSDHRTRQDIV